LGIYGAYRTPGRSPSFANDGLLFFKAYSGAVAEVKEVLQTALTSGVAEGRRSKHEIFSK
jgi:hypothetical protein